MRKTVETVLGPINIEDMGKTLTHEHLWMDVNSIYSISYGADRMSDEKITRENRSEIVKDLNTIVFGYKDNIIFDNVDDMVAELEPFKAAGGKTIFEVSPLDIGRNPLKLKEIAEKSHVNIIMGGTYYYFPSIDKKTKEIMTGDDGINRLADMMIREFYEGVGDTGIKPGVLGELGLQHDDYTNDILLRSALIAQKETGVPLIIHSAPFYALDVAEEIGANPEKIVMGHWTWDYPVDEAIKRGAWVSFDQFGMNFPGIIGDEQRVLDVVKMFEKGYEKQLLLSQDICWKVRLCKYGGAGFADLFENTIPKIVSAGVPADALDSVLCDNPRRLLE